MGRLAIRSRETEQMDAPGLDPKLYQKVLDDLARVNRWTLTARPVLAYLGRAPGASRRFRLLDVGFGNGDILRAIVRWSRQRRIDAELVGIDLNPNSLNSARMATPPDFPIDYRIGDYQDQPETFDFIISSQVAHHMTENQLGIFLRHMEAEARQGWLVSDLHRHAFAFHGYPLLARLLRVHRIVREDGQLSIARSFRPADWMEILPRAGIAIDMVRIRRSFPFRLGVERVR